MPDSLSDRYADLLTGSYDCVDRIVILNGHEYVACQARKALSA